MAIKRRGKKDIGRKRNLAEDHLCMVDVDRSSTASVDAP
jgi:hypothetical protein